MEFGAIVFEKKVLTYNADVGRKVMVIDHFALRTRRDKRNRNMFTGTNAFRNYKLTAQGQSVSLWRSLLIVLSRWDIDSINLYTF